MFSKLNSKFFFLEAELAKIQKPDSPTGDILEAATDKTVFPLQEVHTGSQTTLDDAT